MQRNGEEDDQQTVEASSKSAVLPAKGGDEGLAQRRENELAPCEPAAVAIPKAQDRFSGGTSRPKAAMTMPNDAVAMPVPTITPPSNAAGRDRDALGMAATPSP